MNLWVIIPVKSLQETKSRLGGILSQRERAQLTRGLLERTLRLLQTVPMVAQTAVISQDSIVAEVAADFDCRWAAEDLYSGLNGAVATGVTLAVANGATHCLVLPSDLPFLAAEELMELVALAETAAPHPTLFLCSDQKQQGTNGLILPAGLDFRFCYGQNSFYHHQQEARRLGVACRIVQFPSLQFDLDTEQDYNFYTKHRAPIHS